MITDHEQAYPYVVGALPPSEAAGFEQHLADCRACTDEVAALRAVTEELSSTVAASPPPALRGAVLTAIRSMPQLAADHSAASAGGTAIPVQKAHSGSTPSNVVPLKRSRFSWAPALLAAAAVIAALGFGGWAWQDSRSAHEAAQQATAQTARLTDLLSAPDVKTATGRGVASGTIGTVVLSRSLNEAMLVASDLPTLPDGKVYEAWTIHKRPVPAGTFTSPNAKTVVELPPRTLRASSVAVTIEPAGGSPQPTTDAIVTVNVPESI